MKKLWNLTSMSPRVLTTCLGLALTTAAMAQSGVVTGVVTDENGLPLAGANVRVKGQQSAMAVTDEKGAFTLKGVRPGVQLLISYIGYDSQTVSVSGDQPVSIVLKENTALNEVVVVGYGTQKKSVVTAAIAKVSADDLEQTAPTRVDNALKGLAAGVQVTASSGQPGASSRIRIRGIGTINNSDPLYIVDGMPIEGGIDYINPNDIQSIEVLKDAASGAVYGARAANGVILVTTKKGKQGGAKITYDFSYGISNPWKHRDVLNASEYALIMNEGRLNAGMAPMYNDPYSYGKGTDWQREVFNKNAPDQRHQVSVSGASDRVDYYVSLGYVNQEGIVGGNWNRSNYERLSLRSNTNYEVMNKEQDRDFLNRLKLSANISYANIKSRGVDTNSSWGSPLGSALTLSPILGVYEPDAAAEQAQLNLYKDKVGYFPIYSQGGRMFMVPGTEYNEMVNPIAALSLPGNQGWSHKFVGNFSAELQLLPGLTYRSSYGVDLSFWGNDGHVKRFYLSGNNYADRTSASSESARSLVWQWENTLHYQRTIDRHQFGILLGQSAKESSGQNVGAFAYDLVDINKPSVGFTNGLQENGDRNGWGGPYAKARLASYFLRANYNYDERYMAEVTVRRDGSSRFGSNNHWATFPSVSLGWNLTNEAFMADRPEWYNATKLRFSWGKNGNENIGDFRYTVLTAAGNNYIFGPGEGVVNGVKASGLANRDLKWEESEQLDLGLDFAFFNNRLTFTVDYYKKTTNGMLMTMNIPSYVGEAKPIGNVGRMQNSGFELEAAYKITQGDWRFRVGGNLSYLHNKLIEYGNDTGYADLDSFQGTGTISRAQNGLPFPFFYGYKTAGLFQNMDEVKAYTDAQGKMIQPNAVPGDVRFVDTNGDGAITAADRTKIGKGTPDWTWGLNFTAGWRNFDFSMMWQGTIGNDIFDATRRTDITRANLPAYMLGRWTGEGTSTTIPQFRLGDNVNWQSSDLYVKDGSYVRLKNIQLGYSLPEAWMRRVHMSSLRFYVAAENLLTFTRYDGFDPEISSGGTSLGIDYGVYPQARTFTFGVNIAF